jgi:hypothetical protein
MIDLFGRIERLEAFEEKFSVRLENVSAWFDNEYDGVSVLFELHPKSGTAISMNLRVVVAVYNGRGQIITTGEQLYNSEEFWGFAIGDLELGEIPLNEIFKIRIYPTTW